MALGYDGKLYILAFDHRGSFQRKMFAIEGDPTPEQTATIADAKRDLRGHAQGGRVGRVPRAQPRPT
jgi:tagatose-1,6-bisphosphate aldolase